MAEETRVAGTDTETETKRGTATAAFGVGRRENHDASDFYARFTPPEISSDDTVNRIPDEVFADPVKVADSRTIADVLPANSVALVVTSPPYFVGKEYELAVTGDPDTRDSAPSVPTSYIEYLQMLHDVFKSCLEVLEPRRRHADHQRIVSRKDDVGENDLQYVECMFKSHRNCSPGICKTDQTTGAQRTSGSGRVQVSTRQPCRRKVSRQEELIRP